MGEVDAAKFRKANRTNGANDPGEFDGHMMELDQEADVAGGCAWEDFEEAEASTRYVWDRARQAWVEIADVPEQNTHSHGYGAEADWAEFGPRPSRHQRTRIYGPSEPAGYYAAPGSHVETYYIEGERPASAGPARERNDILALYRGQVELLVVAPVDLRELLKIHKRLDKTPQIRVLDLDGSANKGVKFKLHLQASMPLLKILEAWPEVHRAADAPLPATKASGWRHNGNGSSARRVVLTTKTQAALAGPHNEVCPRCGIIMCREDHT